MVQILVHVKPADKLGVKHFELLDCDCDTSIREIKQKVEAIGKQTGTYTLPSSKQELTFLGELCEDKETLATYGVNEPFIEQVTGFVINPDQPGKRFVEGKLVPI